MSNEWIKTNWYCIRHAVVAEHTHKGTFYGSQDVDCTPCNDLSKWNANNLPNEDNILITSKLKRTIQTANAIKKAGAILPEQIEIPEFNEQCFGVWENKPFKDVCKETDEVFWFAPAHTVIEQGESFMNLYGRTAHRMHQLTHKYAGKNIISVTHGGTIRAMIAFAMDLAMDNALNITIDNQSITLLEHFHKKESKEKGKWRVRFINKLPIESLDI